MLNKTYILHRIESKIQPSWNLETIQSNVPRHHWSPCSSWASLHNPNVCLPLIYLPIWKLSSSHFKLFYSLTFLYSICSTCCMSLLLSCWSLGFSYNHFPWLTWSQFSQFSCLVVSDSLRPLELQDAWPPCPSQTPGVYSNSCPSSQWHHPAISSSVIPFSSCPQSLLASGSFPVSQLFSWGGQSIGVSASASVLPMNTQEWSPLGWTGWISLQSKGL